MRIGIVAIFIFLGGPTGGAVIVALFAVFSLFMFGPIGPLITLMLGMLPIALGILIGFPYAATTGVIYAFLPPQWQKPAVAAVLGALSVVLWSGLFSWMAPKGAELSEIAQLALLGSVAAYACAWIVRKLRMDWAGVAQQCGSHQMQHSDRMD